MMTRGWKAAVVAAIVLACAAVGLAVAAWADVEIAQSDPEAPIYIDMTEVMLRYYDQLNGIGPQNLTVRQVIQDALWYQVNNPQVAEETRMECFTMINLFHEGRATEITQVEYDILIEAMQVVWGPGIIAQFQDLVGGEQ
ncbi:MAG: hypothetical protein GX465_18675 [Acidobacteria bacterium]|nr:hypothetical protein [Acidobacteriota bacterium]